MAGIRKIVEKELDGFCNQIIDMLYLDEKSLDEKINKIERLFEKYNEKINYMDFRGLYYLLRDDYE